MGKHIRFAIILVTLVIGLSVLPRDIQAQSSVQIFKITGEGFRIALSPDGKTLAVFDDSAINADDPTAGNIAIRLLDAATGTEKISLTGTTDYASFVAFTPDGQQLVSYQDNGEIDVWDVSTGKQVKRYSAFFEHPLARLFADGRTLAVVFSQGLISQIQLWNLDTGAIMKLIGPHLVSFKQAAGLFNDVLDSSNLQFAALDTAPDGTTIATASANGEISLWNVADGTQTVIRQQQQNEKARFAVRTLRYTSDGKALVFFDTVLKQMQVWNIQTQTQTLTTNSGAENFALLPDNDTVVWVEKSATGFKISSAALSAPDKVTVLADVTTSLRPYTATSVWVSADGKRVFVGGFGATDKNNAIYIVPFSAAS